MGRYASATVLVLVAACQGVPTPHLPQVEQAAQAVHGGGERYRAHQRCLGVARTFEEMVGCMRDEGYVFIPRSADYPSPECWDARDSEAVASDALPSCFEHAPDAPH